ncbi:uncharacterized protein VTP21DRAFT_1632 [Calcarisporiella thermophila]|uniref:uncharacterized protein n=1 Tax=Calcarisporiella thermophila TaxID=911321 RepID=UPI003741FC8D
MSRALLRCLSHNFHRIRIARHSCVIPNYGRTFHTTNEPPLTEEQRGYRVLFFGSDEFALRHLRALLEEKGRVNAAIKTLEIITPEPKLAGRNLRNAVKVPVRSFAEEQGLIVHKGPVESMRDFVLPKPADLPGTPYDLGVVVSFGYLIPPRITRAFRLGAINVHPSLLPRYRGAAPIQHAILNNEIETGVSIQELAEEFDAGRILKQVKVPIPKDAAFDSLSRLLAEYGASALVDVVQNLDHYRANSISQDSSQITHARKIQKSMSVVDWKQMDADEVYRLHRAIGHQFPLRTQFDGKTVQLLQPFLPPASTHNSFLPGSVTLTPDAILITCADGSQVGFRKVKFEGRGAIGPKDFANGYLMNGKESVQFGH